MDVRIRDIEDAVPRGSRRHAEALAESCGHVAVGGRILDLGYRFYAMPPGDVPSFFCRRFPAGRRSAAATLLAGIDPQTGQATLDDCRSPEAAIRSVRAGRAGVWNVRLTLGPRTIPLSDLRAVHWRREPQALAAIVQELVALAPAYPRACAVCRELEGG